MFLWRSCRTFARACGYSDGSTLFCFRDSAVLDAQWNYSEKWSERGLHDALGTKNQCRNAATPRGVLSVRQPVHGSLRLSLSVCPLHVCVSCDRRLVPLEILMDRCSCVCLPRCFHLALLQRHRGFGCAVEVRSPGNLAGSFPRFAFVRVCLRCWLACSLACASPREAGRLHRGRGFETHREG